jgi:hypothetical protein
MTQCLDVLGTHRCNPELFLKVLIGFSGPGYPDQETPPAPSMLIRGNTLLALYEGLQYHTAQNKLLISIIEHVLMSDYCHVE